MTTAVPQREYETIYILRPDAGRELAESVATRVSDAIKSAGKLTGIENWGRRRLAHDIGRIKGGVYVYFKYIGGGGLVSEVERTLRLQESVLKFQTVKIGDASEQVEVNEAELKFEHIEHPEEDDNETLAQSLGLEGPSPGSRSYEREYEEEDSYGQEDDNGDE
jgi:small subunit ribosomal protein S6